MSISAFCESKRKVPHLTKGGTLHLSASEAVFAIPGSEIPGKVLNDAEKSSPESSGEVKPGMTGG